MTRNTSSSPSVYLATLALRAHAQRKKSVYNMLRQLFVDDIVTTILCWKLLPRESQRVIIKQMRKRVAEIYWLNKKMERQWTTWRAARLEPVIIGATNLDDTQPTKAVK